MTKRTYTFSECKKLLKGLRKDRSFLSSVTTYPGVLIRDIDAKIESYRRAEAEARFRALKVEQLEKVGASKISSLKYAGYKYIYQVYNSSRYDLMRIYGIGQITAEKIMAAAHEAHRKTYASVKVKPEYDKKTNASTAIILAMYKFFAFEPLVEVARSLSNKYEARISKDAVVLGRGRNILLWLFSSNASRERYNKSYDALKELYSSKEYVDDMTSITNEYNRVLNSSAKDAWEDFKNNPIKYFNYLDRGTVLDSSTVSNIKQSEYIPEPLLNDIDNQELQLEGLRCQLRKYQIWGVKYIVHQKHVLLGDEMGLGKTVEAIASLVHYRNNGETHFLVVCPASVLINWYREVRKHSDLKVMCIHDDWFNERYRWIENGGVAITTYGMLKNIRTSMGLRIGCVVIDEAHYIKHLDSQRSEHSYRMILHANHTLLMTGTALENNVGEMVNLIGLINKKVADRVRDLAALGSVLEYRKEISTVYCRRKREEVLDELPQLIEESDWCHLDNEEREVYDIAILGKNYADARRLSWNVGDLNLSCKAQRLLEIIEEAKEEGRKVLVFSFFISTLESIYDYLRSRCSVYGIIRGSVPSNKRQEMIDYFERGEPGSVLVSQIEAGGTGLNIQAASVVVICEPQFKPSSENQAISRAYRMGQARNVIVHRLLCEETIDERLTKVLETKQAIFNSYADKSDSAKLLAELEAEIGEAFKQEYEKIAQSSDAVKYLPKPNYQYYAELLDLPYSEIVKRLLEKYGPVTGDYFLNESCMGKNTAISRSKEGLECHHIHEYTAINLSNPEFARHYPFAYQKADRLVYCNYLEHLLLHIKIAEENEKNNRESLEKKGIGGAVEFIVRNLNDFYSNKVYEAEHLNAAARVVSPDYEAYMLYLRYLWNLIKSSPIYSAMYTKQSLIMGFDGRVNTQVLKDLNTTES